VLHAAHIPSTIPGSGGQVAPGTETTDQAHIVNALGTPFVLEGLFGEADAEAIDAEPDSELAADAMGMDVENGAEGVAATADGGMIVDDDGAARNHIGTLCVFHPTYPRLETVKKFIEQLDHVPDITTNNRRKRKRAHSPDTSGTGTSGLADLEETGFDTEMRRVPKRLRLIAVRSASLPTAAVAVRSRRAERQARRKRERTLLHKASGGVGRMQVDS